MSLTAEYLKECVTYEPETGEFTWLDRPPSHFKSYRGLNGWRSRCCPGQLAGGPDGLGYTRISIDGTTYKCHRLAWLYVHGEWPAHEIDHINGVRSDNRISNLRDVPRILNMRNCRKSARNSSGVSGLHRMKQTGRWQVTINTAAGKQYLGSFTSKAEAVRVRKAAERQYGYHPNHGRLQSNRAGAAAW